MCISAIVKDTILNYPNDYVFGAEDFEVELQRRQAVTKALQRLAQRGVIKVLSKGRYYKPRQTFFGNLKPSPAQLAREFLVKDEKMIGYLTGVSVFADYSLTTQIASKIQIGTNKYRKSIVRSGYIISFVYQPNPITAENISILPILDCLKFIKKIPATTADKACQRLIAIIRELTSDQQRILVENVLNYTQSVRALCGAILEYTGTEISVLERIRMTISGATKSVYNISETTLPTIRNWRIYEPSRK